jgi:hypothetical protein
MTATISTARPYASEAATAKVMRLTGWALTALVLLFLLFDAVGKLLLLPPVIAATRQIGYPEDLLRPLGVVILICGVLYAIPRTAVFGAILLTGFLGGDVLFGVYVGVLAWGGLFLRDARLRALMPLRRLS